MCLFYGMTGENVARRERGGATEHSSSDIRVRRGQGGSRTRARSGQDKGETIGERRGGTNRAITTLDMLLARTIPGSVNCSTEKHLFVLWSIEGHQLSSYAINASRGGISVTISILDGNRATIQVFLKYIFNTDRWNFLFIFNIVAVPSFLPNLLLRLLV